MAFTGENRDPTGLRAQLNARFHGPLLKFFQRRLGDAVQAEDFTQEVLLRVIRAGSAERIDNPESFVFRVAVNLLRDRRRRFVRAGQPEFVPVDESLESELENHLVECFSPERVVLGRDTLSDVLKILDELEERTRNIFILFKVENMKQKDIAELYGMGLSTVQKHIMKASLHLASRYG